MVRVNWLGVLELLTDMFDVFSRSDCGLILAGFKPLGDGDEPYRLLHKLERDGLLKSSGGGAKQQFRVTAAGIQTLNVTDPAIEWNRPWDKRWRIVSYDLPEKRRRERQILWRALRQRRFGSLQRSVWIWPHDVQQILMELVSASGIPECFIGFEAETLLLATHAEVVAGAWPWREIARRQQTYLKHAMLTPGAVARAKAPLALAQLARIERQAFQFALGLDPLLPTALLPEGYAGPTVLQRRRAFRQAWRRRWASLAGGGATFG